MKIVSSSDWRDALAFDVPVVVADVIPGEDTRCSVCGGDSPLRPRTELWAVKHRHPKNHDGHVRFYCAEHRPVIAAPAPVVVETRTRRAPRSSATPRVAAPRRAPQPEAKPRAMCPECFVEVSATGECGMCGWSAA